VYTLTARARCPAPHLYRQPHACAAMITIPPMHRRCVTFEIQAGKFRSDLSDLDVKAALKCPVPVAVNPESVQAVSASIAPCCRVTQARVLVRLMPVPKG